MQESKRAPKKKDYQPIERMTFDNQVILQCEFHIIICIIVLIFTVSNVIVQLYEALRKQCY